VNAPSERYQFALVNLIIDDFLGSRNIAVSSVEDAKIDPHPGWGVIGLAHRFKQLLSRLLPAFQHHRYGQVVDDGNVIG